MYGRAEVCMHVMELCAQISFLPAANPPDYASFIRVIHEEKVRIVETAGNNPAAWIKKIKDGGCVVIHKCTTVRHAETAVKAGAEWIRHVRGMHLQ